MSIVLAIDFLAHSVNLLHSNSTEITATPNSESKHGSEVETPRRVSQQEGEGIAAIHTA